MTLSREPREFICCECGARVVQFGIANDFCLCILCLHEPGWTTNPRLVNIFDSGHLLRQKR